MGKTITKTPVKRTSRKSAKNILAAHSIAPEKKERQIYIIGKRAADPQSQQRFATIKRRLQAQGLIVSNYEPTEETDPHEIRRQNYYHLMASDAVYVMSDVTIGPQNVELRIAINLNLLVVHGCRL
jgi:DNA-binding LacI/PurR family transcriptional regulator